MMYVLGSILGLAALGIGVSFSVVVAGIGLRATDRMSRLGAYAFFMGYFFAVVVPCFVAAVAGSGFVFCFVAGIA